MGYHSTDLYYQPEKFGLEKVGEIDIGWAYEFVILCVWRRPADGAVFYAQDSGCSCPSPFEGFTAIEHATPVTVDTWDDFLGVLAEFGKEMEYAFDNEPEGTGWTRCDIGNPKGIQRRRWSRIKRDDALDVDKVDLARKVIKYLSA